MPDRERLIRALKAADAAGDTAAATKIAAALRQQPTSPPLQETPEPQAPKGNGLIGAGETALQMGTGMVGSIAGGLAGIAGTVLPGEQGQGAKWTHAVQDALTYQPRTQAGQKVSGAVAKPFELLDKGATWLGDPTEANKSPLAATAIKTAAMALPMLIGRGAVPRGAARTVTPKATPAPTTEALRSQAGAAYKAAEDAGVIISKDKMKAIAEDIKATVADEGIDATLHPDSMAALNRVMAAAGENTSLKGAEILRRVIQGAGKSLKPDDQRIAAIMRDKLDEHIGALGEADILAGDAQAGAAALAEARGLWSRTRKSEVIEELMHRAELSAPNFSASGMENAIRTEFRNLAKNQKRMRQFNAEERLAIERVAKGGPVENTLRLLGKFAPTGAVSTATSGAAGFLAGGPIGAIALPVAGGAARLGAKNLTLRNAQRASDLMRRGESAPKRKYQGPGARQQALAAALSQQQP
jgi:hypothetical protein